MSAAPGSSLAGQILDASLRTALLDFSHQEEGRTVVDADRLLEHCRNLGYGLIGTAAAPMPFLGSSPMDEGHGWEEGNETLGGEGSGAPTGEETAQSEAGSARSSATTRALEEVKRYTGDLRSPGFEAAMAHDPLRLSVSDPALAQHRPVTEEPAPTPEELGLEVVATESAPSSLRLTPGTKTAGSSRSASSLHRSKKRARESTPTGTGASGASASAARSKPARPKPAATAVTPSIRTPAQLQAVVREASGREIRLSAFVAKQRLEELAKPTASTPAPRPIVFATDSESEPETPTAENPDASTKPKHPEESKKVKSKPESKSKAKSKSLSSAVKELEGSLSSSSSSDDSDVQESSKADIATNCRNLSLQVQKKASGKEGGSQKPDDGGAQGNFGSKRVGFETPPRL